MRRSLYAYAWVAAGLVGCNALSGVGDLRTEREDGGAADSGPRGDASQVEETGLGDATTPLADAADGSASDGPPITCMPSGTVEVVTASPSVVVDDARVGSVAWTNLAGPKGAGGEAARATLSGSAVTHWLLTTGYGFALPTGATVRGLVVTVVRSASFVDEITDYGCSVVKAGNPVGLPKLNLGPWPTSTQTLTYGSATNTWGQTWTAELVNATDFGAAFAARGTMATAEMALVDHVTVTVHFERCN